MHSIKTHSTHPFLQDPLHTLRLTKRSAVVMTSRDYHDAFLFYGDKKTLALPGVKLALATGLFRDGSLTVSRAARVAGVAVVDFIAHLSRLRIPVVTGDAASLELDMAAIDAHLE